MNRFFSSLQIKFLIVFSIVFAITLASTGIYLKYSANFAIRNVGDSIEQTRAKQVENIISELYLQQDWDDLQNTVEQLGILTDQQIIVTNSQGQIVADSQNLNFESKLKVRRLKQREANISRKNQYTMPHIHEDASWSCVYYVTPTYDANLYFKDPLPLERLQLATDNSTLSNLQPRLANIAPILDKSLIISGVGAGIIGIIIISLLSRRLLRSVHHLTLAAKRISNGDFSQRIAETGKDEIGELNKTFNMMTDRLENTNIHRKNLMADIAHEIRTPVSNIQGYIEAVKDNVLPPNTKTIDIIHGQVTHLSKLIEDLRLLALTESDSLKLQISHESIQELIEKCISANNLIISEKNLEIHLKFSDSLPLIEIDRTRILQVLDNIVGNAITHTTEKGRINISVKSTSKNTISIFIANSGSSISEKDMPYIFDRFYRVDQSRTRTTGGSGLGLPIAKQLINAHNGDLKVESNQDEKEPETTFIITLPKKHNLHNN